jgi:glycosyltransferase involved in cell wall biosynthesis
VQSSDGALVAINARAAVRSQIGGVERLAREMARRLPVLRPDRYRVLRPDPSLAHRAGHAWEQAVLPLRAGDCALIYSPANLAPLMGRRNVVVIHDAAALRHPAAYSAGYVAYQRQFLPRLARRARLVITVSEFSRGELVELLDAPPERITVIAEGVDERFSPSVDPGPARAALGLRGPYVLAVGTASGRKNVVALEPVAAELWREGIEVVLAGSERGYLRRGESRLRRLGYVPEPLLPGLYAGALAVVTPSRYEGFGLPCLEAMAAGVPVVATRAGALPETVGDAGLLVDLDDPGALLHATRSAIADASLRARLTASGRDRAHRFTWERTARETDAAIGRVLESGS